MAHAGVGCEECPFVRPPSIRAAPSRRSTSSNTSSSPKRRPPSAAPASGSAQTLARLDAHSGDPEQRRVLLKAAADAVYAYFIQRELCGYRRHDDAIREFAIPREVLVRLGAA